MKKAVVSGISVILIVVLLMLTACGGEKTSSSTINTGTSPAATSSTSTDTPAAAGRASALSFLTQPGGAKAGQPFAVQPVVAIVDVNGVRVTSYVGNTALRIDSGDGEISGGVTAIFIDGLATFKDVTINKAGVYTIKAVTREIKVAVSQPFTVEP